MEFWCHLHHFQCFKFPSPARVNLQEIQLKPIGKKRNRQGGHHWYHLFPICQKSPKPATKPWVLPLWPRLPMVTYGYLWLPMVTLVTYGYLTTEAPHSCASLESRKEIRLWCWFASSEWRRGWKAPWQLLNFTGINFRNGLKSVAKTGKQR